MAIELVTGKAGHAHITSAQLGAGYASIVGAGQYVAGTGAMMQATIQDANTVRIADGDAWVNGRHVTIPHGGYEDLAIESGSQGQNRNDLVVIRYAREASTGVESASLEVVKGTPVSGQASDPDCNAGTVMDGSTMVDMPLWRIPIRGIAPQAPVALSPVMPPMAGLQSAVAGLQASAPGIAQAAAGYAASPEPVSILSTSSWSQHSNGCLRWGRIVSVSLTGSLGSAIPAWTTGREILALSALPAGWANLAAVAQNDGVLTPVLCSIGADGRIRLRTANSQVHSGSWVWISGTYLAGD